MTARARPGAALALALFALVVMAAIADAVLAPAMASRRAAWRLAAHHATESEAERAIGAIAGAWAPATWRSLATGAESVTVRYVAVPGIPVAGVTVESRVRRLGASVFRVAAHASAHRPDAPVASYRSLLVELQRDATDPSPALTAGGDVAIGDSTALVATGECAPPGEMPPPAWLAHPGSAVTRAGVATTEGSRDTTARAPGTYALPVGLRLSALVAAARIRLEHGMAVSPAPREIANECVEEPRNWGAHGSGACAAHAPVVVGEGDLVVRGGEGQGAIVVTGRLTIEGPFRYRGLIVASGGIETKGGPVTIDGALFTSPTGGATLHGSTTVTASACAFAAAADATTRVAVVPLRAWWR